MAKITKPNKEAIKNILKEKCQTMNNSKIEEHHSFYFQMAELLSQLLLLDYDMRLIDAWVLVRDVINECREGGVNNG